MNKVINTLRLILRPITLSDAEAIFSWGKDPRVNKTVIYPLYTNIEDVKTWIKSIKPSDNQFVFVLKDSNKVIGSGGIGFDKSFDAYNLGYNLHYDYWGKGYGSEAAKALMDYAISLGAKKVVARHFDGNIASSKIIKKLGFVYKETMDFNKAGESKPIKALIYYKYL